MIKTLIFFVLLITSSIYSQYIELIMTPYIPHIYIHPDYPNIIATRIHRGTTNFLLSKDSGKTFRIIDTYASVEDIVFLRNDSLTFFAELAPSSVLRTDDGGKNWERLTDSETYDNVYLLRANPLDGNVLYAARYNNELWKSYDKGKTFNKIYTFDGYDQIFQFEISESDTSVIYAGLHDLFRSSNAGKDWEKVNSVASSLDLVINPYDENSLYLNASGLFYRSFDGGKTIHLKPDAIRFYINSNDTSQIYRSNNGISYKSNDGGNSWNVITPKSVTPLDIYRGEESFVIMQVNPKNFDEIYGAFSGSGLFKSADGGESWELALLSSKISNHITNTDIEGELVNPLGEKSINGGKDWIKMEFDVDIKNLYSTDLSMNLLDQNYGYMSTNIGLFSTENRGLNWKRQTSFKKLNCVEIHPQYPEYIVASGHSASMPGSSISEIYRSKDYGNTWDSLSISFTIPLEIIFDKDEPNTFYTYNDKLYKTTDFGDNYQIIWDEFIDGLGQISDVDVSPLDKNFMVLSSRAIGQSTGSLYVTNDGGENWTQIDEELKMLDRYCSITQVLLDNNNLDRIYVGLLGGGSFPYVTGGLFLTEDLGKSWRKVFEGDVLRISADSSSPRNIYLGTEFGLMKFTDTLTTTSVEYNDLQISNEFILNQNYPNPFNPITTISYSIPNSEFVELKVYDLLGKEVAILVNEFKQSGNYLVNFDGSSLSSGIYFYTIKAGSFIQSKKLVLLK